MRWNPCVVTTLSASIKRSRSCPPTRAVTSETFSSDTYRIPHHGKMLVTEVRESLGVAWFALPENVKRVLGRAVLPWWPGVSKAPGAENLLFRNVLRRV